MRLRELVLVVHHAVLDDRLRALHRAGGAARDAEAVFIPERADQLYEAIERDFRRADVFERVLVHERQDVRAELALGRGREAQVDAVEFAVVQGDDVRLPRLLRVLKAVVVRAGAYGRLETLSERTSVDRQLARGRGGGRRTAVAAAARGRRR
eukprot:29389-Pelagococcus_subviridis.AAC.5